MRMMQIGGTISDQIGLLKQLSVIDLSSNSFQGTISPSLFALPSLTVIRMVRVLSCLIGVSSSGLLNL